MKNLMLWRFLAAVVFLGTLPLHVLAASVMDDCAAWYQGARDLNGNGFFDNGEMFDIRHGCCAADNAPTGKMSFDSENERIRILTEDVVGATLGRSFKNQQVLYFPDPVIDGKAYPNYIRLPVPLTNEEFTVLVRFKPDKEQSRTNNAQYFLNLGRSGTSGCALGFSNDPGYGKGRRLHMTYGANWLSETSLVLTNAWHQNIDFWHELAVCITPTNVNFYHYTSNPDNETFGTSGDNVRFVNTATFNLPLNANYTGSTKPVPNNILLGTQDETRNWSAAYRGRFHMLAFWNRTLSEGEIREAFGMPNPGLLKVGLDGQDATRFFGSDATTNVTLAAHPDAWAQVPRALVREQSVSFTFDVASWQAGLDQVLRLSSNTDSASGAVAVALDDTMLVHSLTLDPGRVMHIQVPGCVLTAGEHKVRITRVDAGTGALKPCSVALEGSWRLGLENGTWSGMQRAGVGRTDFYLGCANWMEHRRVILKTYPLTHHFNLPADLVTRGYGFRLSWKHVSSNGGTANLVALAVNGTRVYGPEPVKDRELHVLEFEPGVLKAGENTLAWTNENETSGHYAGFDFIKLEAVRPSGMLILFR